MELLFRAAIHSQVKEIINNFEMSSIISLQNLENKEEKKRKIQHGDCKLFSILAVKFSIVILKSF